MTQQSTKTVKRKILVLCSPDGSFLKSLTFSGLHYKTSIRIIHVLMSKMN